MRVGGDDNKGTKGGWITWRWCDADAGGAGNGAQLSGSPQSLAQQQQKQRFYFFPVYLSSFSSFLKIHFIEIWTFYWFNCKVLLVLDPQPLVLLLLLLMGFLGFLMLCLRFLCERWQESFPLSRWFTFSALATTGVGWHGYRARGRHGDGVLIYQLFSARLFSSLNSFVSQCWMGFFQMILIEIKYFIQRL